MLSEENKCPEETAILPQRIAEYAAQRQKRITNFVETLDAKRTQQLLNMLPARTMSEIPTS